MARSANSILESFLAKNDVGLEFGSGRSTLWFAQKVSALTSIEHDPVWHNKVTKELALRDLRNVDYLLVEKDVEDEKGQDAAYVRITEKFPKNSFDFILVDGAYRGSCALASLELVRPGGLLIIDDACWFLPSNSTSPKASICGGPGFYAVGTIRKCSGRLALYPDHRRNSRYSNVFQTLPMIDRLIAVSSRNIVVFQPTICARMI